MKSVSEVLLQRRSIRRYERESIQEETMQFVYDAIRNTSTSYNGQQFSVIDIDNQETKEALYALTNQKQIKTCNHFLVFCADYNKIWGLAQKKGIEIPPFQNTVDGIMVGIIDAALAMQNALTAALACGLGCCCIGYARTAAPEKIAELLKLPKGVFVVCGLAMGVPRELPDMKPKQPLSAVIHKNSYWVGMQGRNRYVITILARHITARQIASVTHVITTQGLNIDAIQRLTGRMPLADIDDTDSKSKGCVEFSVRGTPSDYAKMQSDFMNLANELEFDISLQQDNMFRRCRRLICFDMDSTLIETEVIDELAERAGVGEKVRAITARAMRGEIDFKESFKERVALLKGLDESVMREIAENLPITEGVPRLMKVLKRAGYKIGILSGGFTYFGNYLKHKFGIDYVYANELEIENGKLTGRYLGEVVDGKRKAELLKLLAQVENVDIAQTIAVGDGANDLPMITMAGLGIAFHAKPKVKQTARQSISTIGIDGVLYFLGFKDSFIEPPR